MNGYYDIKMNGHWRMFDFKGREVDYKSWYRIPEPKKLPPGAKRRDEISPGYYEMKIDGWTYVFNEKGKEVESRRQYGAPDPVKPKNSKPTHRTSPGAKRREDLGPRYFEIQLNGYRYVFNDKDQEVKAMRDVGAPSPPDPGKSSEKSKGPQRTQKTKLPFGAKPRDDIGEGYYEIRENGQWYVVSPGGKTVSQWRDDDEESNDDADFMWR
jgi:hypothetical protein